MLRIKLKFSLVKCLFFILCSSVGYRCYCYLLLLLLLLLLILFFSLLPSNNSIFFRYFICVWGRECVCVCVVHLRFQSSSIQFVCQLFLQCTYIYLCSIIILYFTFSLNVTKWSKCCHKSVSQRINLFLTGFRFRVTHIELNKYLETRNGLNGDFQPAIITNHSHNTTTRQLREPWKRDWMKEFVLNTCLYKALSLLPFYSSVSSFFPIGSRSSSRVFLLTKYVY